MILQTFAIGSIFYAEQKARPFLLLFLHKNLIDLERFVNLAILQNISIFKSIYNNLQKYDFFGIYHGLSDNHGELKSKISKV